MIERVMIMTVLTAFVLAGMGLIAVMLRGRQRLRELVIRERIALIEKGLVPSPEANPGGFEAFVNRARRVSRTGARYRAAGLFIMALGCALFLLLTFAANNAAIGFGLGGGIAVIGAAAFVNGMLADDDPADLPGG